MTLELARRVAPKGRAVGADIDQIKLELARHEAQQQGVANVEFRLSDVREVSGAPEFDIVLASRRLPKVLLEVVGDPGPQALHNNRLGHHVRQPRQRQQLEAAAGAEVIEKIAGVFAAGDDHEIANATASHQLDSVVGHGTVVDRKEVFVLGIGQRIEPGG